MSLLEGFSRNLEAHPLAPCLAEGERRLNYRQVAEAAGGIAGKLRRLGLPRERPIAVALPKGIDAACAVLAVLAAGHCYLPLDLKAPRQRLRWILEDAGASAVIAHQPWEGANAWIDPRPLPPAPLPPLPRGEEDLAAILYTSGSTGHPKGVALSHRAIRAFCDWAGELVALGPQDRIAAIAPLHFDLSTFDLFSTLSAGAGVHFLPETLLIAPSRLTGWLATEGVTGLYTVPSLLSFWAWKGNLKTGILPDLRFILFAGEVFPTPRLRRLADRLPQTRLYNLYGPTETNVCCHWPVDRGRLEDDQPIPIGTPACGDRLHIAPGDGELWVRGPTLASGYWRQGKLSPLVNARGWYQTGDRAGRNAAGEYIYLGRLDRMLKVSGHRVEPAEIEAALLSFPQVTDCAVVGVEDWQGIRPAAAVVMEEDVSPARIRGWLAQRLPAYMLPAFVRRLDSLPRLSNGKPDLAAVQRLLHQRTSMRAPS